MSKANEAACACASDNGHQMGLTKLELFSAMAMQGIVADAAHWDSLLVKAGAKGVAFETFCAAASVKLARALIAELDKPSAQPGI